MRQFDVYENPSPRTRGSVPFFVILSSHLLGNIESVVIAPLVIDRARPTDDLEPTIAFDDDTFVLSIPDLTSLGSRHLRKRRGSVADQEDAIRRALDRLFTGF